MIPNWPSSHYCAASKDGGWNSIVNGYLCQIRFIRPNRGLELSIVVIVNSYYVEKWLTCLCYTPHESDIDLFKTITHVLRLLVLGLQRERQSSFLANFSIITMECYFNIAHWVLCCFNLLLFNTISYTLWCVFGVINNYWNWVPEP